MRKFLIIALTIGLVALANTAIAADDYVEGGFEASGHVMTGAGWQYSNNKAQTELATNAEAEISVAGPLGRYVGSQPAKKHRFAFFVDEVELDIAKSFGENIRLRADLDFARGGSSGNINAFALEQAYATANIPVGNGIEFLLGRFNAPIGFESVDSINNDTISESILVRSQMRPTSLTGAKLYYAFTDAVDFHFWVANSLRDVVFTKVANVPAIGARLGYNWGDDDAASTVGLSPFIGPSDPLGSSNRHYNFGADIDLNWWITESFALGLEGLFGRASAATGANSNMVYFGGLLNLHYAFSDVWDGTLKYAYANQRQPNNGFEDYIGSGTSAVKQSVHEIALAGGYAVADGATIKLEGRFDIVNPSGGSNNQYVYGLVMGFGYEF